MLGLERRQKIMEKLTAERKVYVSELAKLYKVTEDTIRRDLEKLEQANLLRRSYGGATLAGNTSEDLSYRKRSNQNNESKLIIANKAANLIETGDTVMVDSSTTCRALLQQLVGQKDITVITNSIQLMNDFSGSSFIMICTGGALRANSLALTGSLAVNALAGYYVDYALLSCKAIDMEKGIMESNESESDIKKLMMQHARKTILLVDQSKFDKAAFVRCAPFSAIDTLVTDGTPSPAWQKCLSENHVRLL
ncbi:DeoR/GlpR family DNA-binding transcription regulator [uncultured Selenomonas sp.]|uniref:DeoR/GlpR family DNA-binding transcription regulator n=1 Tax=uncultured Selenomonas sp. TaxID=159275 RepID=UPI0028042BCE|nr:DeoR/GlpR family DNA-binding transcription regulator [uncultured Selenomonas sp.]